MKDKKVHSGYKYISCMNTEPNESKYWFGRICRNYEIMVSVNTGKVVCGSCLARLYPPKVKEEQKTQFPPGWRLMSEFVDFEGKVYYRGVEQPELKGTKPPTKFEKKVREKKLKDNKFIKYDNREKILSELENQKKKLKETTGSKERQKILDKIKELELNL